MSANVQQPTLLRIIDDPNATRMDVAEGYAGCLLTIGHVDWRAVNQLILERWPPSSLEWIKARAWRMAQNTESKP